MKKKLKVTAKLSKEEQAIFNALKHADYLHNQEFIQAPFGKSFFTGLSKVKKGYSRKGPLNRKHDI